MNSKILVIDDDSVILFIHKTLIDISGITAEVEYFSSAELALNYILDHKDTHRFLLLLDINMPNMNGWELLDVLQKSDFYENINIIMITSSVNDADKKKAFSYAQVTEYLTKPIKVADFVALQGNKTVGKFFRSN